MTYTPTDAQDTTAASPTSPAIGRTRIPIVSISIDRFEGPTHLVGKHRVEAINEAQSLFSRWSVSAPFNSGSDKVDVCITWADGTEYGFRARVKNHNAPGYEPVDISGEIRSFLKSSLGLDKTPGLSSDKSDSISATYYDLDEIRLARHINNEFAQLDKDTRPLIPRVELALLSSADLDVISMLHAATSEEVVWMDGEASASEARVRMDAAVGALEKFVLTQNISSDAMSLSRLKETLSLKSAPLQHATRGRRP